jgi:glycosyltransferase involved in cell wall biosynthesis
MALKVLITGSTPRLGLAFQFVQVATWLRRCGVDVVVTGCDGEASPGLFDTLAAAGVPFYDVPTLRRTGLRQLLFPAGGLRALLDVVRPNVALITTVGHVAEARGRKKGDPWVVYWLQSVRNTTVYAKWARRLAAMTVNRLSDQVWIQCELEKQQMLSAGVREELVRLVPTPMDTDWWERSAREPISSEFAEVAAAKEKGRQVLVYPASLLPAKRHDTLLRAVAIVKKRFPRVLLCCPGRFSADPLRPLVFSLGLEGNVMFTESLVRQEAIPPLLAAADLLVFSSESETYGKALIEGFCVGVPTVSTRVGVAYEAEQARAALVCDIGDHETMARDILLLLENQDLAAEMKARARKWVNENYSFEAVGGKMLHLLENLVG